MLNRHGKGESSSGRNTFAFTTLPMNSLRLREKTSRSCFVNLYLQLWPVRRQYPPMPYSLASEMVYVVGRRKMTEFMDIPFSARWRNFVHNTRSLAVLSGIFADPCLSAMNSSRRIRLRKCLADGIMYPTWFSRPIRVWTSSKDIEPCLRAELMEAVQLVTFSCGRFISKGLV